MDVRSASPPGLEPDSLIVGRLTSNWKIQRHPRLYWSTQAQTADSPPSRSRAYICLSSPAKLPSCQNMTHARNTMLASAFPGLEWSTVQHQERRKRRAASSGTGRLHRALEKNPLVAKAWKNIFGIGSTLYQWAILGIKCSGLAIPLVVRHEIGLIDVQEVEDAFEIFRCCSGSEVVTRRYRRLPQSSDINSDDGVILGKIWPDGMPHKLSMLD